MFGCDICQDVCPWNRNAPVTATPEFAARPQLGESGAGMAGASQSRTNFVRVFRGTPVKRAKYTGLLRNVAIAMGNSGEEQFLPVLLQLADNPDPTVVEAANWAVVQLRRRMTEAAQD